VQTEKAKILVLDDDPDIGVMLKLMMEFKGHSAIVATTAQQTYALLKENEVGLIIMDMLLSGANGTEICRKLRSDPATNHIPILMTSAHPNAKAVCLEAGADDFIIKPFDMNDILTRVRGMLAAGSKQLAAGSGQLAPPD
jgi:DNA-binding response OmpR family regulator